MLPRLAAHAGAQAGVFTRAQALAAGYSPEEVRSRLDHARWRTVRRGVYTDSAAPTTERGVQLELCAAVSLCRSDLVVSHASAAILLELVVVGRQGRTASFTGRAHGSKRGDAHVRCGVLDPEDVAALDHMRITTAARTVVDVAITSPFAHGVATADSALHAGLTTPGELRSVLARIVEPKSSRRAQRVIAFADGGSESAGESLVRVLMDDGRLSAPLLNVWIGDYRVDLLLEKERVIVEFDGRVKYDEPGAGWQEKLRQEWLQRQGYEVVRVTWDDVVRRPRETLARIHEAVERSARRTGRTPHLLGVRRTYTAS